METLIELYDDTPIKNVLATEVFRPARTVFLCPPGVTGDDRKKKILETYFSHRGIKAELVFVESGIYKCGEIAESLKSIIRKYPDCIVDVSGGTDAVLFAAGEVCSRLDVPTVTYSRKMNRFYNIHKAPFDFEKPCTVQHSVMDCFLMTGGALRKGRVDNAVLAKYLDTFDRFFQVYLAHRNDWNKMVSYMQRVSAFDGANPPLAVTADLTVKGDHGKMTELPTKLFFALEKTGYIKDARIEHGKVHFSFKDRQTRAWLRDVGSVLELYFYKLCVKSGLFNDVISSAVVDWENDKPRGTVSNEIDVMAMKGILPLFISCKTCAVDTDALNELAILRDRFGGKGAKAAIASTTRCSSITRHRAAQLDIAVFDLDDIKSGKVKSLLKELMKVS